MDKMTQHQHFSTAHRKVADANKTFLELVKGGLTRAELEKNIARRPALWGRFAHWKEMLP